MPTRIGSPFFVFLLVVVVDSSCDLSSSLVSFVAAIASAAARAFFFRLLVRVLAGLVLEGVTFAGIAAGAAAITSATKVDDMMSSGYGKRVLLAPEGAFALNDRDNFIATTNPIPVNDIQSRPAGSIKVAPQQTTSTQQNTNVTSLTPTQQNVKVTPSTTVVQLELNGANIGNAQARSTYSISSNIRSFGGRGIDTSATS